MSKSYEYRILGFKRSMNEVTPSSISVAETIFQSDDFEDVLSHARKIKNEFPECEQIVIYTGGDWK